jgi:hypothetical protein
MGRLPAELLDVFIFSEISPEIMIAQMEFADNAQLRTIDRGIHQAQIELGSIQSTCATYPRVWKFYVWVHMS